MQGREVAAKGALVASSTHMDLLARLQAGLGLGLGLGFGSSKGTLQDGGVEKRRGLHRMQWRAPSQDSFEHDLTPPTPTASMFEVEANEVRNVLLNRHTIYGKDFIVDARYSEWNAIGQGAYGVVASCVDTETQKTVAIKKVSQLFCDAQDAKRIIREIRFMSSLRHPNILALIDVIGPSPSRSDELYIVSELMDTDLHKMIKYGKPLSAEHQQAIMYQLMLGIDHLHASGIVHRDLKPRNILLSRQCELKICDFGLARPLGGVESTEAVTEYVVTRWYRAPEVVLNPRHYCPKVDVWSAGCIFAEMQLSHPFFRGHNYIHQLKLILEFLGTPSEEDMKFIQKPLSKEFMKKLPKCSPIPFASVFPKLSVEGRALLEQMLIFNPCRRISARESLKTSYFENLTSEELESVPPVQVQTNDIEACPLEISHLRTLMTQEISRLKPQSEQLNNNNQCVAQFGPTPPGLTALDNQSKTDTHVYTDVLVTTSAPISTCNTNAEADESERRSTWTEWATTCDCASRLWLYRITGSLSISGGSAPQTNS